MSWQNGSTTEEKVWLYLVEVGNITKAGAAGIMGNMKNESGVIPNRVQMGYGWTDSAYTSAVDSGSYKNFVYDSIGYGLVQFTYWTLKKQVYDTAKSRGVSVGDLETQLICVVSALKNNYKGLYSTLCSSNDVRECCVAFLLQYERPKDQSVAVQNKRTQSAQEYYNKFSGIVSSGNTTTGGSTISISYDRTKDPLLLEFGYASVVQKESDANLGTTLKAQKANAKYPVSAINTADLLNDIFDIWGFNVQGGNSGASDGQQVPGQAKTQSGKVLTSGTWKAMPSSQPQTGVVANYTGYIRNWARGTTQRTIYDLWNSQGRPNKYTVAMVSGYYLIAPGRYFSNSAGDILEVRLENGYKFMAMVGDTKGPDTPNEYGHVLGSGGAVDVIEWESVCSTQSQLRQGLQEWGILNVKVSGMTNFGTFFQ